MQMGTADALRGPCTVYALPSANGTAFLGPMTWAERP